MYLAKYTVTDSKLIFYSPETNINQAILSILNRFLKNKRYIFHIT